MTSISRRLRGRSRTTIALVAAVVCLYYFVAVHEPETDRGGHALFRLTNTRLGILPSGMGLGRGSAGARGRAKKKGKGDRKQVNFDSLDDLVNFAGETAGGTDGDAHYDEDRGDHRDSSNRKGGGDKLSKAPPLPKHKFLPNGLLVPNRDGQHPIYDLIKYNRDKWEAKLAKASRTLDEAVHEYRRRYGRSPPRGFDRWWTWAKRNNVRLPDEYDQIHKDLEPFWAIRPSELAQLHAEVSQKSGMFTISCKGVATVEKGRCTYQIQMHGLNREGELVAEDRAQQQLSLLKDIEDELEDVDAVFYSHDVPWQFLGEDLKSSLMEAAQEGEYFNEDEHLLDKSGGQGWDSACAAHKPLRKRAEGYPKLDDLWNAPEKSFVWDHLATMDPCEHPNHIHLIGYLSGHNKGPVISHELMPSLAMSKTMFHSDILTVSPEGWTDWSGEDPDWEDKTQDVLMWRGRTTGILFQDGNPWNISQRINLVERTDKHEGTVPVLRSTKLGEPVGDAAAQPYDRLNSRLVDIAFVDHAIQCRKEVCAELEANYHFAQRLDWNAGNQYKYMIDLDGNGWSARFKRLMNTNACILKSTIFPEWYSDRIQPWVHYVPIKADLTDMYDVMSFFKGDEEAGEPGHDALARQIAIAGKQWSHNFWREQDMVAYQFRLMLELARIMAPNREAASYMGR